MTPRDVVGATRDPRAGGDAGWVVGGRVAPPTQEGAREWRYVPVCRISRFIEESLENATQWVVFGPNGSGLWARVHATVFDSLCREWRAGGLAGETLEEAFLVTVDRRGTMTRRDTFAGRLVVDVGMAPVCPAEFVVFEIRQTVRRSESAGMAGLRLRSA